jgi:enoyl-CoA hydratase/carnithine racemase
VNRVRTARDGPVGRITLALRLTKQLLCDLDSLDFAGGLALGERVNAEARATEDFRAGVRRFVNSPAGS